MDLMERALTLARQALGTTSPNPAVGAVVVRDGTIVGEGYTQPPGAAHAEVVALRQAGEAGRGATLYTTLEPCCNYGRTPPCTKAIIAAGIAEVHVASVDPNPRVQGKGMVELEAAGIRVLQGERTAEAQELYEAFAKHINTRLPFVVAKFAMSLDGKIATRSGESKWITSPVARSHAQELRRTADAIMVGVNTVLRDNPRLTARDGDGRPLSHQPLRVIVDSHGRTPPHAALLKEPGATLVVTAEGNAAAEGDLKRAGAQILALPASDGQVDLQALVEALGGRDVVTLLAEGGGTLLGSLFDLGLVDKVFAYIAPVILGGREAPSPIAGQGVLHLSQATNLRDVKMEQVGPDLVIRGYPKARS